MKTLQQLMNLDSRVVLITGGAGHIGRAMAESLLEMGATVVLLDRDETALKQAQSSLENRTGWAPDWMLVNLENEKEVVRVPGEILARYGRIDVLINNGAFVGTSELDGWVAPFEEQSAETWRRALEVNLTSAFILCKVCAPPLRESGNGSIVNIASTYGVYGSDMRLYKGTCMGNPAAYAASKGGLIQLTRWLATVLAPDIRVNALSPGGVMRGQPAIFQERYADRTPLQRMACEEDFKGAIAYLASDMSSYVTGQNLLVDGGWGIW